MKWRRCQHLRKHCARVWRKMFAPGSLLLVLSRFLQQRQFYCFGIICSLSFDGLFVVAVAQVRGRMLHSNLAPDCVDVLQLGVETVATHEMVRSFFLSFFSFSPFFGKGGKILEKAVCHLTPIHFFYFSFACSGYECAMTWPRRRRRSRARRRVRPRWPPTQHRFACPSMPCSWP